MTIHDPDEIIDRTDDVRIVTDSCTRRDSTVPVGTMATTTKSCLSPAVSFQTVVPYKWLRSSTHTH